MMIPNSIVKCYKYFYNYFTGKLFKLSAFEGILQNIHLIVLVILIIRVILEFVQNYKTDKIKSIIGICTIIILPIAGNIVLFIATDSSIMKQMTAPLALCIPLLLIITLKSQKLHGRVLGSIEKITIVLLIVLLYGNIYRIQIDQNAMLEGRTSTISIAQLILNEIKDEGFLNTNKRYCIIGRPANNPLFKKSVSYKKANSYAKFGNWWNSSYAATQSWEGVFHNLLGIKLNICSEEIYNNILFNDQIKKMPCFPKEGFIQEKNGIIIVKVSNSY